MSLISMQEVSWGFGGQPLLDHISLRVEKGDRVCLLGRNGVGKSSLLKIIEGRIVPDSGEIRRQPGLRLSCLEQNVPEGAEETIFDIVAGGLGVTGAAIAEHRHLCAMAEQNGESGFTVRRDELQHFLDAENAWPLVRRIENILSRTNLEPEKPFADLSAGMKRRVLFARSLAPEPDLLLLDEPTNHLDIDSILWMEEFLLRHVKTLLFVTHDRTFLRKIANRIVELDRGRLSAYSGGYDAYLVRRQADLESEERRDSVFDKKLSAEEAWIRQGVKARRTRNEGRVRSLLEMRERYKNRRKKIGDIRLQVQEAERSGRLVIEADTIRHSFDGVPVIQDFSGVIMRGDKVGIIGPNGAGKTTLLRILLREMAPEAGTVRHGTNLQVAYFDQLRDQLDETKTVQENIAEGNDFILHNGAKRHVIGYLRDFLFAPDRCRTPVHVLSGGEKNRLLLAKLFTRPANLLVMDEPTNDLDMETLELLEELLFEYQGTLLLVSHDRSFLNNVVTGTIAFEGGGRLSSYAGGYDDWLSQRPKEPIPELCPAAAPREERRKAASRSIRKLGFMEKRELAELPQRIELLEKEKKSIYDQMAQPSFYKREKGEITKMKQHLEDINQEIEAAYSRWVELEETESAQNL
ncbi:MAG: ATP-binding cassette domain-containing protein [Thermodesulfobacteriota bacterium]